ncbi:hypothetical protein M9Y10_020840 [Tritrichomonas musculus]|uniref:Uncharacterized protein n=1 Tax=Tritrichomonas musculus TaxID=1915356 RepID=A0ABR2GJK5_9EUKA
MISKRISSHIKKNQSFSREEKRQLQSMKIVLDFTRSHPEIVKNFCEDIKENSSFRGKKDEHHKEHVTKKDILPLLEYLYSVAEPKTKCPKREMDRAGYPRKDKTISYFAYHNPGLMEWIADNLNCFDFCKNLNDPSIVSFKWKEKIKEIKAIKELHDNQSNTNNIQISQRKEEIPQNLQGEERTTQNGQDELVPQNDDDDLFFYPQELQMEQETQSFLSFDNDYDDQYVFSDDNVPFLFEGL